MMNRTTDITIHHRCRKGWFGQWRTVVTIDTIKFASSIGSTMKWNSGSKRVWFLKDCG